MDGDKMKTSVHGKCFYKEFVALVLLAWHCLYPRVLTSSRILRQRWNLYFYQENENISIHPEWNFSTKHLLHLSYMYYLTYLDWRQYWCLVDCAWRWSINAFAVPIETTPYMEELQNAYFYHRTNGRQFNSNQERFKDFLVPFANWGWSWSCWNGNLLYIV